MTSAARTRCHLPACPISPADLSRADRRGDAHHMDVEGPPAARSGRWDAVVIGIADVPWGLLIAVVALGFIVFGGEDGLGKAAPMLTAAGLFGIGHGIHTAAKIRRPR